MINIKTIMGETVRLIRESKSYSQEFVASNLNY
jgi:hypothetical protein